MGLRHGQHQRTTYPQKSDLALRRQAVGFGLIQIDHKGNVGLRHKGHAQQANTPRLYQALYGGGGRAVSTSASASSSVRSSDTKSAP
jgi:hypothetical protein